MTDHFTFSPALFIEGPFGPGSYAIAVTNIITLESGDYEVTGIRSDFNDPEVKELNPTGEVSFIWSGDRIRTCANPNL